MLFSRRWIVVCLCLLASMESVTAAAVTGRFVRIDLPGDGRTLSLAEVQVFSGSKNVALKGKAVQSSTAHDGDAARALDGNTDGEWGKGSVTHTVQGVREPAWEVDLGGNNAIDAVAVWNRNGLENRLDQCRVAVLDAKRRVVWETSIAKPGTGETRVTVAEGAKGPRLGARLRPIKPGSDQPSRAKRKSRSRGRSGPPVALGTAESLRRAIRDLSTEFGARYPDGAAYLKRLATVEAQLQNGEGEDAFAALKREALLANPLLNFDTLLMVERKGSGLGLPANWQGNSSLKKNGYDNQIAVLSPLSDGEIKTLYRPENGAFVGDVDLHFDGKRMLFSSIGKNGAWQVFEINADGSGLRQVTPADYADVDNYDPCYLPDGRIIFDSSSGYQGVPCVGGKDYVANLHVINADGTGIRRLTFEQDNDWYPVMLPNGRVLYLRWEYTDSAHYFSRVLMSMNPDGTDQKGFYGSNSYWPNSLFCARPIPGSVTKFVGIVSGHHGVRRMGELVLFDAARGRHEADGAVQRIPGYGKKVEAITLDRLADGANPKFLHPYPLSDKYFLVSALIDGNWGIYLADVFDNLLLLKEKRGYSLYEPQPLRARPRPPVLPDRVRPDAKTAVVFLTNIYEGDGLHGVPKGAVKSLRVYKYEYAPRNIGGHYALGMEGGWDARVLLGTVPVSDDGSALFEIPANTPMSLQPLDADGKALQLMRSWLVGMPGEVVSCVGCHEPQNRSPAPSPATAGRYRQPDQITPWYGPPRGFAFLREVQPVLDKYCIGCHDGSPAKGSRPKPNFADTSGRFPKSYMALHPYVRRNGPEGDYHLLTPLEFHANTSELVQMLQKGHHGVALDHESWDRLITWIDLNVPALGTWTERGARPDFVKRRLELRKLYAGVDENPETVINPYVRDAKFIKPQVASTPPALPVQLAAWPFDAARARREQGTEKRSMDLDLGDDVSISLVRVPAGEFAMGSASETREEQPVSPVKIAKSFWMAATEVTLKQYRQFDAEHRNGIYDKHYKDQVNRGYDMNNPDFPVIRVSWEDAMAFCRWLSQKTGKQVTLPTEAQWEWACRAGTATPLSFGGLDADFSPYANLADVSLKKLAVKGVNPKPIPNPPPDLDFVPKDTRFSDGVLHLAKVGSYQPNNWGLYDMHGNVAEWTRSLYAPYPYRDSDGRNSEKASGMRAVRGGSWRDRQYRATSSYRLAFPDWQCVYNVGFRIIVEEAPTVADNHQSTGAVARR